MIDLAPGDSDAYLALERVLVQMNSAAKLQEAIAVLERLLAVDPKQARSIYQRMSQYALQLYHDDDAIKYASRAVELNPDDAEGHRRLGEMYRQRQDADHAITEFRAAIAKNDRLFVVYFDLADLLLSKGQSDDADRLFRRVIRGAPDEEYVARAARLSMQINLGRGRSNRSSKISFRSRSEIRSAEFIDACSSSIHGKTSRSGSCNAFVTAKAKTPTTHARSSRRSARAP